MDLALKLNTKLFLNTKDTILFQMFLKKNILKIKKCFKKKKNKRFQIYSLKIK